MKIDKPEPKELEPHEMVKQGRDLGSILDFKPVVKYEPSIDPIKPMSERYEIAKPQRKDNPVESVKSSDRGRQMDSFSQISRIRSLSKPSIPMSKEQKRAEIRRALYKDFNKDLPGIAKIIMKFLGHES
jgi:hypothetical protein